MTVRQLLLVEDDEPLAEQTARALEHRGNRVAVAHNAEQALALLDGIVSLRARNVTAEDLAKTEQYRGEAQRQELQLWVQPNASSMLSNMARMSSGLDTSHLAT